MDARRALYLTVLQNKKADDEDISNPHLSRRDAWNRVSFGTRSRQGEAGRLYVVAVVARRDTRAAVGSNALAD